MRIRHAAPLAFAALLAVGAVGGTAYAEGSDGKQDGQDAAALANMKVTLPQAIATAEQQAGGRAVSADASQENGVARIEVEVAGPKGAKTVVVDGQTGQVTTAQAEGPDNGQNKGQNKGQDNGQDGESND